VIVLFYAETFDKILGFSIFLDSIGFAASAATIFIFRKRSAGREDPGIYKMKLFPLIPLIFIAAYLFVAVSICVNTPELAGIGTAVFFGFLLLYFIVKNVTKADPK
jgi:APA family basic amino acid/polyamine antiporter